MNSLDQSWFFVMDDVQCVGPNCTQKTYFDISFLMVLKRAALSQSFSAGSCTLLSIQQAGSEQGPPTLLHCEHLHFLGSLFHVQLHLLNTHTRITVGWISSCINFHPVYCSWRLGRMCCLLWQCQRSWSLVGWAWAPACAPPARRQQSKENPEDGSGIKHGHHHATLIKQSGKYGHHQGVAYFQINLNDLNLLHVARGSVSGVYQDCEWTACDRKKDHKGISDSK